MNIRNFIFFGMILVALLSACSKPDANNAASESRTGLKIAFVNGDSVLHRFEQFRKQADAMDERQRKAEQDLQAKGAALQNEIVAYQKKAQGGNMTPKEMQAHEKYLSTKQDAILAERDKIAKEMMQETEVINKQLQEVLHKKLDELKQRDGYDYILNAAEGGSVLSANEKYDITDEVVRMLNEEGSGVAVPDTSGKQ